MRAAVLICSLLWSAAAGAAGVELTPPLPAVSAHHEGAPSIAAAGDTFFVYWSRLMRVDADAKPVWPYARDLGPIPAPWTPLHSAPLLARGDEHVLVAARSLTILDRDGELKATQPIAGLRSVIAAAVNGGRTLVVGHAEDSAITAVIVSMDGSVERVWPLTTRTTIMPFGDAAGVGDGFIFSGADRVFRIGTESFEEIGRLDLATSQTRPFVAAAVDGRTAGVWWAERGNLYSGVVDETGRFTKSNDFDPLPLVPGLEVSDAVAIPGGFVVAYRSTGGDYPDGITAAQRYDASARPADDPLVLTLNDRPLAMAASGDRIVAAVQSFSAFPYVVAFPISTSGGALTRGSDHLISVSPARQDFPAIATDGVDALASWHEETATEDLAAWATCCSTRIGGAKPAANVYPQREVSDVAFNGSEYLVVWTTRDDVLATRVARDGVAIDETPIVVSRTSMPQQPAVAWTGNGWVVVWIRMNQLLAATVSAAGVPGDTFAVRVTPAATLGGRFLHYPLDPDLAWNGTDLLLVWTADLVPFTGFPTVYPLDAGTVAATRLRPDGTPYESVAFELSPSGARPRIATDASGFLVAWDDLGRVVSRYVRIDSGFVSAGTRQLLFDAVSPNVRSDVVWTGRNFALSLRYLSGSRAFVGMQQLAPGGKLRIVETSVPEVLSRASLASDAGGNLVAAASERRYGTSRVIAYDDADLADAPPPPASPTALATVPSGRSTVTVAWRDNSDDEEGFAIELWDGSVWRRATTALANATTANLQFVAAAQYRIVAFNAGGASAPSAPVAVTSSRMRSVRR